MNTAVSVRDDVFRKADRVAARTRKSRTQLFTDAIREYAARHAPDEVTEVMDRVCAELENANDEFVSLGSRRTLEKVEW